MEVSTVSWDVVDARGHIVCSHLHVNGNVKTSVATCLYSFTSENAQCCCQHQGDVDLVNNLILNIMGKLPEEARKQHKGDYLKSLNVPQLLMC